MSTTTLPETPTSPTVAPPPAGLTRSRVRLTAADIAVFPRSLPSGDVCWELRDGEPIPMSPPGYVHGKIALRIAAQLLAQGEEKGHGEAGDEVAIVLRRNPDRVRAPDALFITKASLPARLSPEGYLETIPELVVEVESKNDTGPDMAAKRDEYFDAGVRLIWAIDPDARTVTAHQRGQPDQTFQATDALTCPLIPGFAVPVANLFAGS